jgi:sec-independent protein translocase protein TatC
MKKYLLEIKNRVILLAVSYCSVFLTSYFYKNTLLFLIIKPANISTNNNFNFFYLIFTDVTEILYVYFNLIFFVSFQMLTLMSFYHFFLFISPALYKTEFKYSKLVFISISFVGLISFIVAHFAIIPLTWDFFFSFQDLLTNKSFTIHFEAKLVEYFNFHISLYFICWIYFQFFGLLFLFLNYINNNYKNVKKIQENFLFRLCVFFCFDMP